MASISRWQEGGWFKTFILPLYFFLLLSKSKVENCECDNCECDVDGHWTDIGRKQVTFTKFQYKHCHSYSKNCITKVMGIEFDLKSKYSSIRKYVCTLLKQLLSKFHCECDTSVHNTMFTTLVGRCKIYSNNLSTKNMDLTIRLTCTCNKYV